MTTALAIWTTKVAPNMDWDHKPRLVEMFELRTLDDHFFEQPGTGREVFYDIYSNVHYRHVAAPRPGSTARASSRGHPSAKHSAWDRTTSETGSL